MPVSSTAQAAEEDEETDEQLDRWLVAKRSKDFETADAIRDELRAVGVDPDTVRPRGWEASAAPTNTGDAWTEMQLDKWLAAKRSKDFATADAIRDNLRQLGVDPDTCRPRVWESKGTGKGAMGTMGNMGNMGNMGSMG